MTAQSSNVILDGHLQQNFEHHSRDHIMVGRVIRQSLNCDSSIIDVPLNLTSYITLVEAVTGKKGFILHGILGL